MLNQNGTVSASPKSTPATIVSGSVGVANPAGVGALRSVGGTLNTSALINSSNTNTTTTAPVTITNASGRVRAVATPTTNLSPGRVRAVQPTSTTTSPGRVRAVRTDGALVITNQKQ